MNLCFVCEIVCAVSVECVNICKFRKGEGGKYDCSVTSCASKAPRALTGFLATTAHASVSPRGRKFGIKVFSMLFVCFFV